MKRLVAMTITAVLLLLPAYASAEADYILTFDRAKALMNVNNGILRSLEREEKNAFRDYGNSVDQAKTLDTEGVTINYDGKDLRIYYDFETQIMMKKAKELYPEQMKFAWESAKYNRLITANYFVTTLRGAFLGVYSADTDVKLKQKQLDLASMINKQDKIKSGRGLITGLDMEESNYHLLKAQKSLDNAKRNYENSVRSFDQFTGLSSSTGYTDIIYEEQLTHPDSKPVEYYIKQALDNRFDILSIKRQIALKEQEKGIIESNNVYKISTTAQIEYESLLNDIEQLSIDLESMELSVTNEIRNAYVDVLKAGKSVDSMNNTLKLQQSSYSKMQARYKAGMISENMLKQAEIGLLQIDNGYRAMLFDYNTKITRFINATGIGPRY